MPGWPMHPRLAACRRVFLKAFELPVRIGVHDFERRGPQRLLIDVDLYVSLAASTPHEDRLDEVVDYDFIRGVIAERVAQGHIGLQETLCDEIAARMLAHPEVCAVRVSTEKPDVYPDCAAVGVEVFHIKESAA
ncbi:dihydroneopterin aldolase [Methylibium sp.]|uniref:dihydroneopterin aldolase n=1 Tax=Methylibium sp. TaxID=2067992 RepID=UPI003D0E4313